jgi:osomolarity two-component system sensor histidine kinase SLN1
VSANSLIDASQSREGLDNTGMVLLVGPNRRENLFGYDNRPASADYLPTRASLESATVKYIFPPLPILGNADRHSAYNLNLSKLNSSNFTEKQYPAVLKGYGTQTQEINNSSSLLSTHNENNDSVAVGFARPQSRLVDWLLIVEQGHDEAWAPISRLRMIILACVFGTIGLVLIVVVPMAHYSVRPIRRLRDATEKSVAPPGYSPNGSIRSERDENEAFGGAFVDEENTRSNRSAKNGLFVRLRRLRGSRTKSREERLEDDRRRVFKIPAEVPDRKHWITDEVSELTTTFNAMSRELLLQYTNLEEKVATRTQELELSKKAAEAANESKTLFIANISHELKTPLNGILGMCAVCMGEDDLPRIKRSLQIVYKSGDLLLHLLNDLLTFSKNQIGQQLSLEEKQFRLSDIKSQITTIFDKQVQEGRINFKVKFISTDLDASAVILDEKALPALGPQGLGRLKDMSLWGDQHRILQVIINLVSNSLKFTPEDGKVEVRIKCLGEAEPSTDGSRMSSISKQSSTRASKGSKSRGRHGSGSNTSQVSRKPSNSSNAKRTAGTALLINPMDPTATPRVQVRERSPTPPPSNAKTLMFQFEVEDTGPGIPPHLQERVFEPFVQADLGLSKKYGGTGLGLSICSQLAGLMGGEISLVSTEGVGTTFNMRIPLKHVKSRAPSTSSSDIHVGSRAGSISSQPHGLDDYHPNRGSREGSPPPGVTIPSSSAMGFQKDTQPRLVGLSQPFFAAAPSTATLKDSKQQLAALDAVPHQPGAKLRVLVAEDNLINQEVVLRYITDRDFLDD